MVEQDPRSAPEASRLSFSDSSRERATPALLESLETISANILAFPTPINALQGGGDQEVGSARRELFLLDQDTTVQREDDASGKGKFVVSTYRKSNLSGTASSSFLYIATNFTKPPQYEAYPSYFPQDPQYVVKATHHTDVATMDAAQQQMVRNPPSVRHKRFMSNYFIGTDGIGKVLIMPLKIPTSEAPLYTTDSTKSIPRPITGGDIEFLHEILTVFDGLFTVR